MKPFEFIFFTVIVRSADNRVIILIFATTHLGISTPVHPSKFDEQQTFNISLNHGLRPELR